MLVSQVSDHTTHRLDLWTYRMPEGPLTRLTSIDDGFLWAPRWTADGSSIRFDAVRKDGDTIFTIPRDGGRPPTPFLTRAGGFFYTIAHHPDGRRLASVACIRVARGNGCQEQDGGLVILTASQPDSVVVIADARALFRLGVLAGSYDVLPGDSTFIMNAPNDAERTRVTVIANFVEQLRGLSDLRR